MATFYSITGTLVAQDNTSGSVLSLVPVFQVVYLGNGSGGASQADTLTIDVFSAFQSSFGTGTFTDGLTGAFSTNIASTSSVKACVSTACSSSASPPSPFDLTVQFSASPSSGGFSFDYTDVAVFGAGSPLGSYILFGQLPQGPQIVGVVSASAFGEFSDISPGSWIEIYGTNLAVGTREWGSADFSGVNAPLTLGGTSVTVGGMPAYVDYISPLQVDALVPEGVGTGPQPIAVSTAAGSSSPYPVTVNTTEPGLLAPTNFNIGGAQYVVAQFADGTYVAPPGVISGVTSNVAHAGDTIVIYGIGFGSVNPNIPPGQLAEQASTLALPFTISFGGVPAASIAYDGLAPGYTGLYQFDVVVPSAPAGNTVPLTFTLNGISGTQTLVTAIGN